ncbi:probable transmembrane ascorbate ferrireductase 2 isoform X3 [Helianthus annuus]|uniref:probable transmembrane ascorbate ferrireductase 2 isoform X3 n=1 Tax=Helianthus annuus TaxID=4232 RepID=UPI000B8F46A6|nr:probable transmembrane ascorbate ferrireductase 2 isoform X3 [Helianthus annuus]
MGLFMAALVLIWNTRYRGGLAIISDDKTLIFNWGAGFATFWHPGGSRNSRASLLPWHVFFGVYIYVLAVAACVTGLLEKATFLQTNNVISRYSAEAMLVNILGVSIVFLCGFVILGIILPPTGKGDVLRGSVE